MIWTEGRTNMEVLASIKAFDKKISIECYGGGADKDEGATILGYVSSASPDVVYLNRNASNAGMSLTIGAAT